MTVSSTVTHATELSLPEGAGWLTRCKVGFRALKILSKRKDDGVAAPIFNVTVDGEVFTQLARNLALTDNGQALLRERPSLDAGMIELSSLRELPAGTLDHALAHYYEDNRSAHLKARTLSVTTWTISPSAIARHTTSFMFSLATEPTHRAKWSCKPFCLETWASGNASSS
jgi:hypothetical protein